MARNTWFDISLLILWPFRWWVHSCKILLTFIVVLCVSQLSQWSCVLHVLLPRATHIRCAHSSFDINIDSAHWPLVTPHWSLLPMMIMIMMMLLLRSSSAIAATYVFICLTLMMTTLIKTLHRWPLDCSSEWSTAVDRPLWHRVGPAKGHWPCVRHTVYSDT